ncbi:helix-turn-helix domain-containing protein [Mucilaginibacter myungsuensis]|uniref:Helix-turn-helix transcriptional regulator n=1 Tax=Mucilaginibacter myungsuensis TaxID=649104 RepID=A0A929KYJ2_9SPHI|nr:AraC family transcriptional regulator [Mucilaginibacter myungsuensis]MBE9662818.1 helix-turn-helix transcriptional regulator [Mucilaginibacter myungsuensis]MDN3598238.1 AraC family transcriptional regulator [Mucilaginibacter myungsuensis]
MRYDTITSDQNTISYNTDSPAQPNKLNDGLTLHFVFGGDARYSIGKRELTLHPDQFLILNNGTKYTTKMDPGAPVDSFAIAFDQSFLHNFRKSGQPYDQPLNETLYPLKNDLRRHVQQLKSYMDEGQQNEALINESLKQCLENYDLIYTEEISGKLDQLQFANRDTKVEILRRLNLAKEYVVSNYSQNISLNDVAAHACLSVNHLLRTFKQAFGQSPHQYLVQVRLQRAKQLLRSTALPVNQIVNMVGFECASSFIRLFRSRYGVTPFRYRSFWELS